MGRREGGPMTGHSGEDHGDSPLLEANQAVILNQPLNEASVSPYRTILNTVWWPHVPGDNHCHPAPCPQR